MSSVEATAGEGDAAGGHGGPDAPRRVRPYVIGALAITAMIMSTIDQSIVATALPTLQKDLHAPVNWAGWTITAYQFGLVLAMPVAGRISDQFGRRRVFLVCLVVFTVSSLLCATAQSIYLLVVFRAIQALGGGAFAPSTMGILSDHFGANRDRAIGMLASTVPIGSLSGPLLGGTIVAYWSWRGIFLINIPIGIAIFLLSLHFIPHSRPRETQRADFKGTALLGGMLLPLMFGITSLGERTSAIWSARVLAPLLVSALCGYFFVRHIRSAESPIIPLGLLRGRPFGPINVINYLYGGCALGIGALLPLYAETRYHFRPLEAGSFLSARAIGVLSIASGTTFLLRRIGYRRPMIAGFGVGALGMVAVGITPHGLSVYAWLAIGAAVMGIGNGMAAPSTNNAVLHLSPQETSSISGLRGMFRQFGAISVISATTAITARSSDPGVALGHVFIVLGILVTLIAIPLTLTFADYRGTW